MLITVISKNCHPDTVGLGLKMKQAFEKLKFVYPLSDIQLEFVPNVNIFDKEGNPREVLWNPTIDVDGIPFVKGRYLTYQELEDLFLSV